MFEVGSCGACDQNVENEDKGTESEFCMSWYHAVSANIYTRFGST